MKYENLPIRHETVGMSTARKRFHPDLLCFSFRYAVLALEHRTV